MKAQTRGALTEGNDPFDHSGLELAKWVAIVTMAIDHYGKIVDPALYEPTHLIGRVSFPLFAAIVGYRLALSPGLASTYLKRLLPWALVSQPVYVLVGREWHEGNILFALALGVGIVLAVRTLKAGERGPGSLYLILCVGASAFVEFGPLGVLMIPAVTELARGYGTRSVWAIGPLGLLANLRLARPFWSPLDTPALLASLVLWASRAAGGSIPRLPKYFFYLFYPGHLLALHFVDLYL